MMKRGKTLAAFLCAGVLLLSGCNSLKRELGVARNSPDEFTVVKRAPLTLPPDYALRPPADAEAAPPAAETADAARSALFGKEPSAAVKTSADGSFLQKAGAVGVSPDIRKTIDEENGYISLHNRTVADKLIFWDDEAPSPDRAPASVVDAKGEAERLKKNKEEGKSVTEGDVPVIEKKKSTIDKIF